MQNEDDMILQFLGKPLSLYVYIYIVVHKTGYI